MSSSNEKSISLMDSSTTETDYTTEKQSKTQEGKSNLFSKVSPLPKPDFSSIEKKESSFTYKQKGSYKKQKSNIPESPMKSPNQKFFTPVKLQMRNLFGEKGNACRKLDFFGADDILMDDNEAKSEHKTKKDKNFFLEKLEEEEKSSTISPDKFGNICWNNKCSIMDIDDDDNKTYLPTPKLSFDIRSSFDYFKKTESTFERDFQILRTLDTGSFGIVYKCLGKTDGQVYAVKKSKKHSSLYDYTTTVNFINDFHNFKSENIFSNFCVNYKECWLEEEVHDHTLTENHLFILQDFCKYGDLLDYLETLEKKGFTFCEDFYWDLIFEMICGVQCLNLCNYIHLDIKPGNFLIDENGGVKLGDFGLVRKFSAIANGEDLFEGDSGYIAPEFFGNFISNSNYTKNKISFKCDIFSLGLSILEILCKIELPQNGILWEKIRSPNFSIPSQFFTNSNIKVTFKMIDIIYQMIKVNPDERPSLLSILQNPSNEELYKRYTNLLSGNYFRFINPKKYFINSMSEEEDELPYSKRSNSYKII